MYLGVQSGEVNHFQTPPRRLRDAEVPSVISPPASAMKDNQASPPRCSSATSAGAIEFKSFKHPDYLLRGSFFQRSNQDR